MTIKAAIGAADPEMERMEALLRSAGTEIIYASARGRRCHAGNAYQAEFPLPDPGDTWLLVECSAPEGHPLGRPAGRYPVYACPQGGLVYENGPEGAVLMGHYEIVRMDHHRSGDPGYGRPPAEFLEASSLGQVLMHLARQGSLPLCWATSWPYAAPCVGRIEHTPTGWQVAGYRSDEEECRCWWFAIPQDVVYAAAADHCLAAAYRGECPGVDPEALMRWRVEQRAAFQGRSAAEVLADVERARQALRASPDLVLGYDAQCPRCEGTGVVDDAAGDYSASGYGNSAIACACEIIAQDMRGAYVPELPEASAREGLCFVAAGLPGPDGRIKLVCQSGSPNQIRAFMEIWAPAQGLVDVYGDPMRAIAGGYIRE